MEHTCTRKLHFCAGHRVYGHESKCAHLHGHNYLVFLTATLLPPARGVDLDPVGRVVDFSVLKGKVDPWLQEKWDHGFLLWEKDPLVPMMQELRIETDGCGQEGGADPMLVPQKLAILPVNPTAENLAGLILEQANLLLTYASAGLVRVTEVTLWETPNCYATARAGASLLQGAPQGISLAPLQDSLPPMEGPY